MKNIRQVLLSHAAIATVAAGSIFTLLPSKSAVAGSKALNPSYEECPNLDAWVPGHENADEKVCLGTPDLLPIQPRSVRAEIQPGEPLGLALQRVGVASRDAAILVEDLQHVYDMRKLHPGDVFIVTDNDDADDVFTIDSFTFKPRTVGIPQRYEADRVRYDDGSVRYSVAQREATMTSRLFSMSGEVESSLYLSMTKAGEGSALVQSFADVFLWNFDFYRQAKKGDTFKVIVEKRYADDEFYDYGKVLAAEYKNGEDVYRGFDFRSKDENIVGVFDDHGKSLERSFLKSPLEVSRISSRFGQRFHPILKTWRSHNGVDYGAAEGTPFWAVADGVVIEKKFSRAAGNMIVLRHALGYKTQYFHASKFADDLEIGQKVKQRQVIGYVGSTGLSTNPHLHFGMQKQDRYVAPHSQEFPAAEPVTEEYLPEYYEHIEAIRAELDAMEVS